MRRFARIALGVVATLALWIGLLLFSASRPGPEVAAAPPGEPLRLPDGTVREDLRFSCGGDVCAGWLYRPATVVPAPVVILGHGFAGTRDVALEPFALAFAARGIAAFAIDYRCFGASGGSPRQLIDPWQQIEDWHAAMAFVRDRPELDGTRLALWGSSMGAGHALIAAAEDGRVAAVVAQAPLVDTGLEGEAAELDPGTGVRLLLLAWGDLVQWLWSDEALTIPAISPPGEPGMISDAAAHAAFERLVDGSSSTYRNAVAARSILTFDEYDPSVQAAGLAAPVLFIASRDDRFARFEGAAAFAASHPAARVAEIGGDHFDVYRPPYRDEAARLAADFLAVELGVGGGGGSR
jgi:alpha-beta hydrolase superfamily lysophospholipase